MKNIIITITSLIGLLATMSNLKSNIIIGSLCFAFILMLSFVVYLLEKRNIKTLSLDGKQQIQFFLIGVCFALFIVGVGFLIGQYE